MQSTNPLLSATSLSCERGDRLVWEDYSLAIFPGQCVVITGQNGSGKTSLLKMLAGLLEPQSGTIHVLPNNRLFVGHASGIKRELSVSENALWMMTMAGLPARLSIEEALSALKLTDWKDEICGQLSAGQCRRAAFLRLLLCKAPLWILDEPFTALDAKITDLLIGLMREHLAENGAILMSVHVIPEMLNILKPIYKTIGRD